jgi:hypothetical protein
MRIQGNIDDKKASHFGLLLMLVSSCFKFAQRTKNPRHCEERSDVAIHKSVAAQ